MKLMKCMLVFCFMILLVGCQANTVGDTGLEGVTFKFYEIYMYDIIDSKTFESKEVTKPVVLLPASANDRITFLDNKNVEVVYSDTLVSDLEYKVISKNIYYTEIELTSNSSDMYAKYLCNFIYKITGNILERYYKSENAISDYVYRYKAVY